VSSIPQEPKRLTDLPRWLDEARNGSSQALGQLLEACRPYLLLITNQQLEAALQAKVGPSDIVQDTMMEATKGFERFHGRTEDELLAWLRRILLNNLANVRRQFLNTGKRQAGREVSLGQGDSAARPRDLPTADSGADKTLIAEEEHQALQLALKQLSETQRQVIQWRNYELLSFEEIGQRLERSAEAARKLWARAVTELQKLLEGRP
jgi:RNA polymerase sigma-70 factor (ECF subfamily)